MPNISLYSKEIISANVMDVEAGTNCPQGGDTGHGGRTILRLIDQGGTDIRIKVDGRDIEVRDEIEIMLGGDCEHDSFVEALEFAINVYKNQKLLNSSKSKTISVD